MESLLHCKTHYALLYSISQIEHKKGMLFSGTVASREAGVELTGMYIQRVLENDISLL